MWVSNVSEAFGMNWIPVLITYNIWSYICDKYRKMCSIKYNAQTSDVFIKHNNTQNS